MSGNIGQIRVALRKDIAPASYGTAQVEELRQSDPSGDDVLLIVKKFMADTDPIRVVVAVSALQAESLRQRFAQPEGVSPRRVIGANVKKNLSSKVGPCRRQGVLTMEGAAYLTNWVDGTLTQKPRPESYSFLRHRMWGGLVDGDSADWRPLGRERHIDLTCAGEGAEYFSESESDGDAEGPIMFEERD